MSTSQKVVVVTGASQGIGAGIVEGFRERGYRVVATSRTIKESADAHAVSIAGDIADSRTAERVMAAALERFGRVDTLVNNAGIFVSKPFIDYSESDFASVVATNLGGFFRISQLAVAEMVKQGAGHVGRHHGQPRQPPPLRGAGPDGSPDERWPQRSHSVTGDRIRTARCARECGRTRHRQDAHASSRHACSSRRLPPDRTHG